ncbi:MAG: hypothetical protein EBR88_00070 [Betaproteobacteria bacterium]|nr:hypothetical protein [Betaproteobacteria bacterium]
MSEDPKVPPLSPESKKWLADQEAKKQRYARLQSSAQHHATHSMLSLETIERLRREADRKAQRLPPERRPETMWEKWSDYHYSGGGVVALMPHGFSSAILTEYGQLQQALEELNYPGVVPYMARAITNVVNGVQYAPPLWQGLGHAFVPLMPPSAKSFVVAFHNEQESGRHWFEHGIWRVTHVSENLTLDDKTILDPVGIQCLAVADDRDEMSIHCRDITFVIAKIKELLVNSVHIPGL